MYITAKLSEWAARSSTDIDLANNHCTSFHLDAIATPILLLT